MTPTRPYAYVSATPAISAVKTLSPTGGRHIDLSLNESSYGASPQAIAAAQDRAANPQRYPDPASTALRQALARIHDLDPTRIVCGNGSEDLLDLIGRVYARPGDEILTTEHGFAQFRLIATRVGATPVLAPENGITADVDALLANLTERTKILYLANPNNPTGTYVNAAELARLHSALPPSVLLVIDAAYAEYVVATDFDDGLDLARESNAENIIVTHTFSKAYGLAALRVGWAYLPDAAIGPMNLVRAIGNVNAIAQAAALAALDDPDFVTRTRDRTVEERRRLTAALTAIGIDIPDGHGNFLLARFPDAVAARAHLAQGGIVTRHTGDHGLPDHLRITIGLPAENDALIACLRDYLT